MRIEITSFGHSYGTPDADVILDARCLENPFWVPELKEKCGLDAEVQDYILGFPECRDYIERLTELLSLQAKMAKRRGLDCLRIAVGCTGGRHRSVTVAELLARRFREENYETLLTHRDIQLG
ncbi:MAG: hypothetical protein IJJ99_01105 [Oscillospiraceae bacterium]|nr:hypothetical protein [Oscillospiraceae bacterium]